MISIFSVIAIATFANAKTEAELLVEYDSGVKANKSQWTICKELYAANTQDIAKGFEEWKNKDIAKYIVDEAPIVSQKMTEDAKRDAARLRNIYAQHLIANPSEILNTPLRVAILACPSRAYAPLTASNSNFYPELKAKNFVVDGIQLPAYARFNLAKAAKDFDYIANAEVEDGMKSSSIYLEVVLPNLLDMEDVVAAKEKCKKIETYMLKKGMYNTSDMARVQAIGRALTGRIVDAKIIGK